MLKGKAILLDYYDGAYGPTLRIDIDSLRDLEMLRNVFADLSHGVAEHTNLLQLKGVEASAAVRRVVLAHNPLVRPGEKTLRVTRHGVGSEILWSGSSAYWSRCSGLIDGLINANHPGHQYLTNETIDDALVEVAFMERVASALREAPIHR